MNMFKWAGVLMKKLIRNLAGKFGYSVYKTTYFNSILSEKERFSKLVDELKLKVNNLESRIESDEYIPVVCGDVLVDDAFNSTQFSNAALQKLITDYNFETVLDVGAGAMHHSEVFAIHGKKVTAVDYGVSVYYKQHVTKEGITIDKIFGDFNTLDFDDTYDCVWASHVLEHQVNPDAFLKKIVSLVKEGGVVAITVPPFKHEIVGGHVSLWNAGLLLYRLVLAGINCSDAAVLAYGYNISVIVKKKSIPAGELDVEFDCGDIRRIRKYLPGNLSFNSSDLDDPFNGNISRLNW